MTFTPSEITAFAIALATLCGAFFSGVALIITTLRSTKQKVEENTALTEKVKDQVQQVEKKVDGTASRAEEQIKQLQNELMWMRERLTDQRQVAALLAQSRTQEQASAQTGVAAAETVTSTVERKLEQIEINTAGIEQNTAIAIDKNTAAIEKNTAESMKKSENK